MVQPQRATPEAAPPSCRTGCGACCIAPSISSPIPGMPVVNGVSKPAGVRCLHLGEDMRCALFDHPERPDVCGSLMPSPDMCGDSPAQAMRWLGALEIQTAPAPPGHSLATGQGQ